MAPRGYLNIKKKDETKTIIPDPETAPLIKRLFEDYAKGIYKVSELTRMANNWGLRSLKGKPIRQQAIHKILRNKLYTGIIDHKGNEIQGNFEPIIGIELFQRVQFYLGTNTNNTNHPKRMLNPDFPLRVSARCKRCNGGKFTGSWSRGNGGKYAYYHCMKCNSPNVPKLTFETQFMEFLQRLSPNKDDERLFKAIVTDAWKQKLNELNQDVTLVEKQIKQAEEEKQKTIDLAKRSVLDDETAKEELSRIKEKIALLRLNRNELRIDEFDLELGLNFCIFFMQNVHRLWYEANLTQKIKFQEMVFPKGVTYDYQTFGTTEIASIYELNQAISEKKSTMVELYDSARTFFERN